MGGAALRPTRTGVYFLRKSLASTPALRSAQAPRWRPPKPHAGPFISPLRVPRPRLRRRAPRSAPRVNLPAGQFTAAEVHPQLVGVLGETPRAQRWQAYGAAQLAAVPAAGQALIAQARRLVVDHRD